METPRWFITLGVSAPEGDPGHSRGTTALSSVQYRELRDPAIGLGDFAFQIIIQQPLKLVDFSAFIVSNLLGSILNSFGIWTLAAEIIVLQSLIDSDAVEVYAKSRYGYIPYLA